MTFSTSQVILDGFPMNDWTFTMFISGVVTSADIGKAVSLDTATPGTVKLAANDDVIYGRITSIEPRTQEGVTTVTVEAKFRNRLPTSANPAIGGSVVGSGNGLVKPAVTANPAHNVVLFVGAGYAIVQKN